MKIEQGKPIKYTNFKDNTVFYGILVMVKGKWMGLLDGDKIVKFTTYTSALEYCHEKKWLWQEGSLCDECKSNNTKIVGSFKVCNNCNTAKN